ncbi:MAG: ribokinase [Pseudomonadota bacterium]
MSAPAITVVGSINLDLVGRGERLPMPGETVLGGVFAQHPGGKGANQALAARRLGADVSMVGCVGNDKNADAALALLRADGVDLTHCRVSATAPTGVALIAVSEAGENQILVAPGANAELSLSDLPEQIDGALIAQFEVPLKTVAIAAKRTEGLVCLNLAPAMEAEEDLLRRADLLIVNETEAAFYGRDRLLSFNKMVALTLGSEGAVLFDKGSEVAAARPPATRVVDTTGAGDTFVAALTVALMEGADAGKALMFACAAGARAVSIEGAQPSLPSRQSVEEILRGKAV